MSNSRIEAYAHNGLCHNSRGGDGLSQERGSVTGHSHADEPCDEECEGGVQAKGGSGVVAALG